MYKNNPRNGEKSILTGSTSFSERRISGKKMDELRESLKSTKLTKTGRIIAEFVVDNMGEACFMTSTDIAVKLDVSESSVIRFARALGFTGFMDFQRSLRKSYTDNAYSVSSNITVPYERLKMSMKRGEANFMEEFLVNTEKNISSVIKNNTKESFDKAANLIIGSNKKYIIASRANSGVGAYTYLLLKHMLPNVYSTNNSIANVIDHLSDIGPDDCVIVYSFPRYSKLDRLAVQMADDAGAKIVVVTDKRSALLAQYAEIVFTVDINSSAFFNSYVGVQCLMEMLCANINKKIGYSNEEKLKNIDKYINEMQVY